MGLLGNWRQAASELGLELQAPYTVELGDGVKIKAVALLRNFGAPQGMLILSTYEAIEPYEDAVSKMGFGYSVMRDYQDGYDRDSFVSVLRDWEWVGAADDRPEWL